MLYDYVVINEISKIKKSCKFKVSIIFAFKNQLLTLNKSSNNNKITRFKGCLQKRQHQIGGIHGKMGERAQHYVHVYKEKLDHVRTKKVTYVRHTFATIYS